MANEIMAKISPESLEADRRYSFKIKGMPLGPEEDENPEARPTVPAKPKKKNCCKSV